MKVYFGKKVEVGPADIMVMGNDGSSHLLPHIVRHSPDGFQWGYGGSGPSDSALSILTDFAGKIIAERYYMDFKAEFLVPAKGDLNINGEDIMAWLKLKMKDNGGYL